MNPPTVTTLRNSFKLYDCTMRYALRSLTNSWPIPYKCNLISSLLRKNKPDCLEIGIMSNKDDKSELLHTKDLLGYCSSNHIKDIGYTKDNLFLMVPPHRDYFQKALEFGVNNISVVSSVSNSYQRKTLGKNIAQTHSIITQSLRDFHFKKAKVYLTCIDTCPETNKRISVRDTAGHVASFALRDDITNVTLSDTVGNMPWWRLYALLDALRDNDVPPEKIGFQLRLSSINSNRFDQDVYGIARMIWGMHTYGIDSLDIVDPSAIRSLEGRRNEYITANDFLYRGLNYNLLNQYLQIVEKNAVTEEQQWESFLA